MILIRYLIFNDDIASSVEVLDMSSRKSAWAKSAHSIPNTTLKDNNEELHVRLKSAFFNKAAHMDLGLYMKLISNHSSVLPLS